MSRSRPAAQPAKRNDLHWAKNVRKLRLVDDIIEVYFRKSPSPPAVSNRLKQPDTVGENIRSSQATIRVNQIGSLSSQSATSTHLPAARFGQIPGIRDDEQRHSVRFRLSIVYSSIR